MSLETQQQENKVGKFAPNLGIANIQNILINQLIQFMHFENKGETYIEKNRGTCC